MLELLIIFGFIAVIKGIVAIGDIYPEKINSFNNSITMFYILSMIVVGLNIIEFITELWRNWT